MKRWIEVDWNIFHNKPTSRCSDKILYADLHIAQQTSDVKQWLHKCKAALINVSGGTTSRVQPLDVSINKPLKNYVRELLDQHLAANLVLYIEGKLTVEGKLTFTKKWVAEAWGPVMKQPDVIINLSQSCGLSNNMEQSEDDLVNISYPSQHLPAQS